MSTNTLPEYLEAHEVEALIARAPGHAARLLFMLQWRAGLRVSEALALERRDLNLETDRPTLRVRVGKGGKSRIVPVHPDLKDALALVLNYTHRRQGPLVPVSRSTAWRWVQEAVLRAERDGLIERGRRIGAHTLRHSYARHLLMSGVGINYVSRWLGHASIKPTLVYLELVPDSTDSFRANLDTRA